MARLGNVIKNATGGRRKFNAKRGVGGGSAQSKSSRVSNAFDMPEDAGIFSRAGTMAKWGWNNAMASAGGTKMGLARGIGGHALRGGMAGGAIGGTMEASQGGSFWEGAKSGAMNGAVGWGAWRTMGRMTGAGTRNPLRAFGKEGVGGNAATMWNATGSGKVSKQAVAILNQKQMAGVTRMTMNANKK